MIGIFDSGLGGLSALREVRRLLPSENIAYFGDTGRIPYGTRSRETIIKYALQDLHFLLEHPIDGHGLDAVLVACGTVSSNAMEELRAAHPGLPIIGVIDSAARRAASHTKNGIIGVSGTSATVASGAFDRAIRKINPDLKILSAACPLFVSLVENGFISPDDEVTRLVADRYLAPIREAGADTLILGCTHFPIIAGSIRRVLPDAELINVSASAAEELRGIITARGGTRPDESGQIAYYVSDEPHDFKRIASIFLQEEITAPVTRIDIEKY